MKFLLDQDVYAVTACFLDELGHDVITASQTGHAKSEDFQLLQYALEQKRLLVTRDRDFGNLVFARNMKAGIIYLRILPTNIRSVHQELKTVLNIYLEAVLLKAFVVVEPGRHRFRKTNPPRAR